MHVLNAANAGLRRARGRFVVPKALDTYFTEAVIEEIARAQLKDEEAYRCDRYDVALTPKSGYSGANPNSSTAWPKTSLNTTRAWRKARTGLSETCIPMPAETLPSWPPIVGIKSGDFRTTQLFFA